MVGVALDPPRRGVSGLKAMASAGVSAEQGHDAPPFIAVGTDAGPVDLIGDDMRRFVGHGALQELLAIVRQQLQVVAYLWMTLALAGKTRLPCGFSTQVKEDFNLRRGDPKVCGALFDKLPGFAACARYKVFDGLSFGC